MRFYVIVFECYHVWRAEEKTQTREHPNIFTRQPGTVCNIHLPRGLHAIAEGPLQRVAGRGNRTGCLGTGRRRLRSSEGDADATASIPVPVWLLLKKKKIPIGLDGEVQQVPRLVRVVSDDNRILSQFMLDRLIFPSLVLR